jgi:hypothetical protein
VRTTVIVQTGAASAGIPTDLAHVADLAWAFDDRVIAVQDDIAALEREVLAAGPTFGRAGR